MFEPTVTITLQQYEALMELARSSSVLKVTEITWGEEEDGVITATAQVPLHIAVRTAGCTPEQVEFDKVGAERELLQYVASLRTTRKGAVRS